MNAISLVVDSLDHPSSLIPELKKLGRNHGRRNIQTVHFRVSPSPLYVLLDN